MSADLDRGHRGALWTASVGLLLLPLVFAFHPTLGASDMLAKRMVLYLFTFGVCTAWLWMSHARQPRWLSHPLLTASAAYVGINLLSLLWATNPFSGLVEGAQLLVTLLLYVGLVQLLRVDDLPLLGRFIALGGLLLSLVGIAQYNGVPLPFAIPSVGLPSGTFVFRNLAASYLIGAIPFGLLALQTEGKASRRALWALSSTAMLLFLVYTRTRGAWFGFAFSVVCVALLTASVRSLRQHARDIFGSISSNWKIGLVCLTLFILGILLPARTSKEVIQKFDEQKPDVLSTVVSGFQPGGDRGRLAMWSTTLRMIGDAPILGVGLDNWEYAYPLYDRGEPGGKITEFSEPVRPHNDFLWIVAELGLLGIGIYLWLLVSAVRAALRMISSSDSRVAIGALLFSMGLAALLANSLFSFPKEQPGSATLFWVHLAGLVVLSRPDSRRVQAIGVGAPILGLLACTVAAYLNVRNMQFDHLYHRARVHEVRQQWLPASRLMELAIETGGFDHRAFFLHGRYLHRMGNFEASERAYMRALAAHPNYAHTHHNLGGVRLSLGKESAAIESLHNALDIRPGYTAARVHLGNALMGAGRLSEAIEEFKFVRDRAPNSSSAAANLGAAYLQQGEMDLAIRNLTEATQLDRSNPRPYNNLGMAYEARGNLRAALEAFETALLIWKDDDAYRSAVADRIEQLRVRIGRGN